MVSFPVLFSDTVKNNRWAAEFYRPGFSFEPIDPSKWCKIRQITSDRQYGMSLVMNQEGRGFPIYRLNEIDNCFLSETPEKCADVSRREAAPFFMKDGDILFCRTNGNINYVGRTGIWYGSEEMVFASYLVKVRTKRSELTPEYLAIYLNTSFGRRQIVRRAMPSNQVNVSASELMKIDVYVPDVDIQKEISGLVRRAYKFRKSALLAYSTAQSLLSSSLNEGKLKFDHPLSYTTKFSDVMREGRTDADYFQVPYVQLAEHIRGNAAGFVRLTEYCDFLSPNANPDKTPNEEFSYVELADINAGLGVIDVCEKYRGGNLPSRARRRVKPGDVLASSVVGSIDKSAVIGKDQGGFIASTGFFHLRPKGVPSEFLLMLMRSTIVQMQLRQQATGGILSGVPDARVRFIVVPKIDRDVQKEVAAKVQSAHKKHKESLVLFAAAKARVEELIDAAVK